MSVYDAAIVGAGPAGAASAILLARQGWRVAVVDRAAFPRDKPCAEYLSPAAEPLLARLGVLDALVRQPVGCLRGFRIYAPDGSHFQGDFAGTHGPDGQSLFETGLAIPRLQLDATLVAAAREAGAEVREGWRLATLAREDGITTLSASTGATLRARLILAADGIHSVVARRLGLHRPGSLRKIALVAHLRGIEGLTPYGEMHVAGRRYVGLAPLEPATAGDLCNVALVVDEARDARSLAGRPQAFLLDALRTFPALRDRLGALTVARPTLTISRIHASAREIHGDGLLLVGDAAGYYDPFTGEGIYRALHSAELAAQVAHEALTGGKTDALALAPYARLHREAFRGKRAVERIIQSAVAVPPLMSHIARQMRRHPGMADRIVAVTGDFLPPSAVLNPSYLLLLAL
ncbi:MAG TPA: NAD(P)/FAD-dependent oxidoreductase [Ktedonobacterales bacterium]